MRKTLFILFLLPFLYFNMGYYPVFLIKQQMIKQEMKHKMKGNIPANELTEFFFSKSDFKNLKWIEKNEFIYKDHMYDVIRMENSKNDSVRIICIDDIREKALFARLEKITKTSEKNKESKELFFYKLLIKDYLPTQTPKFTSYFNIKSAYPEKKDTYNSFITDKLTPPPEFC